MYRWQRYLRDHPRIVDTMIALILVTLSFPGIAVGLDTAPIPEPQRWSGGLLMGIACAAFLWHRRHLPVTVVVTIACTVAVTALGYALTPLLLAPAMAVLFLVAVRTSQRTGYAVAAATIVIVAGTALIIGPASRSFDLKLSGPALWLLLPAAVGGGIRLRLAYIDAVRTRAEYAERTRTTTTPSAGSCCPVPLPSMS